MARLNLLEAARMVEDNYAGTNADDIETTIDVSGVQATYLKNGVLVIPGTNELSDWFDFNLNFAPVSPLDAHGFEVVPGDSGTLWHGGFLKHAQMVYMFAKAVKPMFIVGHSLGAASAQIVGMSLAIPTIGFASPQTCRSRERLPNEGWVVNFCRIDDHVCHMPPKFLGFRTIGSRYWLKPDAPDPDEDHKIHNYAELLRLTHISDVLPMDWPA